MKICRQALYAQVINGDGLVRACGWAGYYTIGNLIDNDLHEVYHSEEAKLFRQTLIDGTYDFCNAENCPYMANGTLEEQLIEIDEIPDYPEILSLAYDKRCNYHCTCCISRCDERMQEEKAKKIETEIEKALPYVKLLSANGLGELFVSESIQRVISKWDPIDKKNAVFEIETNGSLFTAENWKKIENIGKYHLKVFMTVMSFDEATYQFLSGTSLSVNRIVDNLYFIKELRNKGIVNYLEIATVVQERNFRTLPQFIDRCINEFQADKIRVRRFLPEKAMNENIEWFFDVRNPLHPYHKEYLEVMKNPILKHPKVWIWTGDNLSNRGDIPAKANYEVLRELFLNDGFAEKFENNLLEKGYDTVVLYAITDIAKALIKVLPKIKIAYVLDRNTKLTEWNGYEVRKPVYDEVSTLELPILVSLVARHDEMEENLRKLGYSGNIIKVRDIIEEINSK